MIHDSAELEEWKKYVDELELEGQKELHRTENVSPIPFPSMNHKMYCVYSTLCPNCVEYKKYRKSTIPVKVLSLIALSEKEKYFDRIEIWSDDKSPDPLVVGIKDTQYSRDRWIVARWGDELRPFAELTELAYKRAVEHVKLEFKKAMHKFKTADPEVVAREFINGTNGSSLPTFYINV